MTQNTFSLQGALVLAPMAGVTDFAFREVCARVGAGVTVTEMVSAKALCYGDKKTASLLKRNHGVLWGAQIFGSEPEFMARGAQLALELSGADFIDINMGCPMPKIVNNGEGSALLKNPELAGRIVRAVKDAVPVPVTVKCRKGWDKGSVNVVEVARILQDNGADAIAVHGRTRSMLYSGVADWDVIAKVKQAVTIPVIANGDVISPETALRCLNRTGADGLMIGRASFGDPWLFSQVRAAMDGQPIPERPPLARRMDLALEQMELARDQKGEHIACLEARKQLSWYLRGVRFSNYYKQEISKISGMEDVYRIIRGIQRDLE